MPKTLRTLILGLAALISFAHAAPDDDPAAVTVAFYQTFINGETDIAKMLISPYKIRWAHRSTSASDQMARMKK